MTQNRGVNTNGVSNRTSVYRTNVNRTNVHRTNVHSTNVHRTNGGRAGTGRGNGSSVYIYDNTARRLDVQRELKQEPRRRLSHETRKNRDKARHMNLGYVVFLVAAFCTCGFILINYIQLQSELTNRTKGLASLESRLNTMKLTNDEDYSRITSSIDLEEIKKIAIGELGMTYAKEGQIITYNGVENDYMRQVGENSN